MPTVHHCKPKHEKHSYSSSSSSSSEDEEELIRLQEKKLRKYQEKVNKIEILEDKVKHNEKKDKKVEKKVETLEDNVECKLKKWRLKYRTVVKRLRKVKCLMVNGCDAYGSFYSVISQTVQPNNSFIFEYVLNMLNFTFVPGSSDITVLRDGIYTFNLTVQLDQPSQVAIFLNNLPQLETVTASNSGTHIVTLHQLLSLKKNDVVSFRNYISSVAITTSLPATGTIQHSQNLDFTLYRIAPLPESCCVVPCLNENAWCDFESEDSKCSDYESKSESCSETDTEKSHSSKFCKEEKKDCDKKKKKHRNKY